MHALMHGAASRSLPSTRIHFVRKHELYAVKCQAFEALGVSGETKPRLDLNLTVNSL